MIPLIEPIRNKEQQARPDEDIQLELQIQRDIQDVFAELFEVDEELETEVPEPERALNPSPLRSEAISKRKLQEAVDSLLGEGDSATAIDSSRKKSRFERQPVPTPPLRPATFLPFSPASLGARLDTFTLPSFSSSSFTPREAAEKGWSNKGRERLVCGECMSSWIVSDMKGLKPATVEKLKVRMRQELIEAHKGSCPWRITTESRARVAPASSSKPLILPTTSHLLALAATLAPWLPLQIRISYPDIPPSTIALLSSASLHSPSPSPSPSTILATLLLVVFNWTLHLSTPSTLSTPFPPDAQTTVVQCSSCFRRVGLWTFALTPEVNGEAKAFDLSREHLGTCVFRQSEGKEERWKVVLDALVKGLDKRRDGEVEAKRKEVLQDPKLFLEQLLGPKVTPEELRKERMEVKGLMERAGGRG